jgi:hypothetical protein
MSIIATFVSYKYAFTLEQICKLAYCQKLLNYESIKNVKLVLIFYIMKVNKSALNVRNVRFTAAGAHK